MCDDFCRRTFARRFETFMRYLEIQLAGGAKKLILDALLEFIPDEGNMHHRYRVCSA